MFKSVKIKQVKADTDNNCIGCIFREFDFCIEITKFLELDQCENDKQFIIEEVKE